MAFHDQIVPKPQIQHKKTKPALMKRERRTALKAKTFRVFTADLIKRTK